MAPKFLSEITGSFAFPAAENPTVAMVEAVFSPCFWYKISSQPHRCT